jgi:uncharacterized protein
MADSVKYFEKEGEGNTEATVKIALEAAKSLGIKHIVVSSTTGKTARRFIGEKGVSIIAVSHAWGFKEKGKNSLPDETRQELSGAGIIVLSATHALSAGERGVSAASQGAYPLQIIAQSLKFFGQGTKVAVEIAVAALDSGLIPYGEPVIAVGGTRGGADTALVLVPSYSSSILETRIQRILAKPLAPTVG